MKHLILVKWKETVDNASQLKDEAEALFRETLAIPGIHGVKAIPGLKTAANRYDLMIAIDMNRDALPAYNESTAHKRWKAEYGERIEKTAIFDAE